MTAKPLFRWNVGPCHSQGFEILTTCIHNVQRLYDADLVICYNQLEEENLDRITAIGVPLMRAVPESLRIGPKVGYHVHWKLYPPRVRPQTHELCLDNDILITKRVPQIDLFLKSDYPLLYQGLHGLYGQYADLMPKGIRFNSGIYGLPPNFDFASRIDRHLVDWQDYFDEQGLVAHTLSENEHVVVPLTTIPIIEKDWPIERFSQNVDCSGFHFVGANRGDHPQWIKWQNSTRASVPFV